MLFNPHNNTVRSVLLLFLFLQMRKLRGEVAGPGHGTKKNGGAKILSQMALTGDWGLNHCASLA